MGRAARLAEMTIARFTAHVSRLGIPVVRLNEQETRRDMDTLEEWPAVS